MAVHIKIENTNYAMEGASGLYKSLFPIAEGQHSQQVWHDYAERDEKYWAG